ncbi:MAG TPA: hypothetical protein VL049_07745, partial [Candidatus Dormibacteraeota bacterium]|nr:hypothetical protein [Candidatus Dormibacteraeota bacterium]
NIALGSQPVSACPSFADNEGQVTMAQLILGVNDALNGCTVVPTPPSTSTETPTVTPTMTPAAGNCTLDPGNDNSHLELHLAALDNPVRLPLSGSIGVDCTVPENANSDECTCEVRSIDPITIPNIGTVCISARPEPCPPAGVECDGGDPLGIDLRSDGNVGACTSNDACGALCETHCAASGVVASLSGCTGYCSLSNDVSCTTDADCLPDNGACNGPDPVGASFDVCQCSCIDAAGGAAGRAGEMQCTLGAALTVERSAPCGGGDVTIDLGSACIPLTTATTSTLITDANFTATTTVPKNGVPAASSGAPVGCPALVAGELSGYKARGAINFFGSALGDLAALFAADCQ